MSKKSVAVQISGNEYKIRSDSDEESLRKLARYVDSAMQRVREGTGTIDSLDVAVLTCLNLAREIVALKETETEGTSEASLRALIERVESACPGGGHESVAMTSDASSDGIAGLSSDSEASSREPDSRAPAKTLDLPSIESIHDRDAETSSSSSRGSKGGTEGLPESEAELLPETRMAAGGRDRAS